MFGFRKKGAPAFLIAGLGNPGEKYEATRHNAGFLALDAISAAYGARVDRLRFRALTGEAEIGGERCLLVKPQTFMNDSGIAIEQAASFYKIPPERVLILFDDISLNPGQTRIRRKGSDGGHNGMKSIIACLNSEAFPRIKLGVGAKPHPAYDLAKWVLSKFTPAERKALEEACGHACAAAELIVRGEIDQAMNQYNS